MRFLLCIALALASCAHAPATRAGYAVSKAGAAEVCMPQGERDWLESLRCPSGERPKLRRTGPVGPRTPPDGPNDPRLLEQMDIGGELRPGDPDLHEVDAIEVQCGNEHRTLYVDMNHCANRSRPPPPAGFQQE